MALRRSTPVGPVQAYRTFQIHTPRTLDYYRKATCGEVDCQPHQHGWAVTVIAGSEDEHLCRTSGRRHLKPEALEGGFLRFVFPPGQPCFKADLHKIKLERPPLFYARDGDWRGNPTGRKLQRNQADWIDEFKNNQARLREEQERG